MGLTLAAEPEPEAILALGTTPELDDASELTGVELGAALELAALGSGVAALGSTEAPLAEAEGVAALGSVGVAEPESVGVGMLESDGVAEPESDGVAEALLLEPSTLELGTAFGSTSPSSRELSCRFMRTILLLFEDVRFCERVEPG